jgi:DNA-binding protein H-NS
VINLIAIEPESLQVPDYDAYISLKAWFIDYLDEKISLLQTEKERHIREIEKEIDEIISNIKKYKEILIKYPLIVDFLYMNRGGISVQSFE